MTEQVWLALIAMIGASLGQIGVGVLTWLKSREAMVSADRAGVKAGAAAISAEQAQAIGDRNHAAIRQVGTQLDGRITQLLALLESGQEPSQRSG